MSENEDRNSAAPPCALVWVKADVAESWPDGCKVLIRRTFNGKTQYEADDFHRPDWVRRKLRAIWTSVEWAMIEKAE